MLLHMDQNDFSFIFSLDTMTSLSCIILGLKHI